jgi:hypothetical protein
MKPRSWFPGSGALLIGVAIWLVLAGIALFIAWPWMPRTPLGWIVVVLLSPPALLAMEWLGKKALPSGKTTFWTGKHERTRISNALTLLVRLLVLFTIYFGAVILVGELLRNS